MRKYACLSKPLKDDERTTVKIMLYEAEEGIYLFEYSRTEDVQSSADLLYGSLEELYEEWNPHIDEKGWMDLEDPLPGCQHDAFIPLRVKGRDTDSPQWGCYETLVDGKWVEYTAEQKEETEKLPCAK